MHEILGKIVTASDSDTAADSGTTQQSGQYKIYPSRRTPSMATAV